MIKVLVYILFFVPSFLLAQHPILKSVLFSNDPVGMRISLTLAAGNTCNGIRVFHSGNPEIGFDQLGIIPGICGDSENDSRHSYVHEEPIDFDSNYYYFEFGGQGISDAVSIFYIPNKLESSVIHINEKQIVVYPSEATSSINNVALYNTTGSLLGMGKRHDKSWILDLNANMEVFYLLILEYANGNSEVRKIGILP